MKIKSLILAGVALTTNLVSASFAEELSLSEFSAADNERLAWSIVNDGVMGGLSKGKIALTDKDSLVFSGNLSLKNNGGFSSLRSKAVKLDLSKYDALRMRVKGDGRTYQLRLESDARFRTMEVSFMGEFETKKGEWIEVSVPFDALTGSFRGMEIKDAKFNPAKIQRIGLLLADKKAGAFSLEVDWIRATAGGKNSDLVSIAAGDERFTTLVTALNKADLVDVLKGEGTWTVFAPTNEAFAALPDGTLDSLLKKENKAKLQEILKYHVVSGSTKVGDALKSASIDTIQGAPLSVVFQSGTVRVNDAVLIDGDIQASNGIIHVINAVLLPPAPETAPNTLKAVAEKAGNFKTLLAAVDVAGLTSAIEGDGPLTVFAPTDEAFASLPKGTVESLLKPENLDKLKAILTYHVVSGKVSAGDALNAGSAQTLNGASLTVALKDGMLKVNDATIRTADIDCENGVIHVIDAVLLPLENGNAKKNDVVAPAEQIQVAINKGVPLYNNGEIAACADVYQQCFESLSNDERLDGQVRSVFARLVKEAKETPDADARAWMLRRGLDTTLLYLAKPENSPSHE